MLKRSKKLISVLIAFIMLFSALEVVPVTVRALDDNVAINSRNNAQVKEEVIQTVLNNRNLWNMYGENKCFFIDVDFDGKLEFIKDPDGAFNISVVDTQTNSFQKSFSHASPGYLDRLTLYKNKETSEYIYLAETSVMLHAEADNHNVFTLKIVEANNDNVQNKVEETPVHSYKINPVYNNTTYFINKFSFSGVVDEGVSKSEYDKFVSEYYSNLEKINFEYKIDKIKDDMTYDEAYDLLEKSYDGFIYNNRSGLRIYSDHTNLNVKNGDSINIGAGIFKDDAQVTDISKLIFSVDNTSILSVSGTSVHENCRFVKLKAKSVGTTYVTFSDSNTGYITRVPITVFDNNLMAFTVSGVPTQNIEKYTTNFYNVNGLFVDSYTYSANSNKTTTVSFDVYNTNYIYGAVEVYNSDGLMTDAVIIDKMTNNAGSIKSTVWDNTCCLIRDIIDNDLLSYRQESGYSKKTSVKVDIPENGYIKITTDTSSSFLVGLVNGVDILIGIKSIVGDIKGFDVNSKAFADKITKKLVNETIYAQFIKDEDKFAKKLFKNVAKKSTIFNSESLGNFAETFANNLSQLNLEELIFDTAADFGWSVGESVFEYFSGPIGTVLKGMFTFGDLANLIIEDNDYVKSSGSCDICIQNQGGGIRTASQIKVKADTNFNSDTALKVFEVHTDSNLLDVIKTKNPELYMQLQAELTLTYNISMIKDGKEVQPGGEVEVSIPIPNSLKIYAYSGLLKIYRIEDDGSTTEMDTKFDNGCLVFRTTHFSLYSIIPTLDSSVIGDVNGDTEVNAKDRMMLTRYLAKWTGYENIDTKAADVNNDGVVNAKDRMILTRHLAKWKGYETLPFDK